MNQVRAQEELKRAVGEKAATFVKDGMLVGLGTGSTASYFITSLIERVRREKLKISAVSSSIRSAEMAQNGGIELRDLDLVTTIDLTVDGADEVDPYGRMIKGGGGALLREKIVASSSKKMIVIVDEAKLVDQLGNFGLPVEILPFGHKMTLYKIEQAGYKGALRKKNESLYLTDNGNYIYDIRLPSQFPNPEKDHDRLVKIPGVIDTGFFLNLPTEVLVAYKSGEVSFRT